MKKKFQFVTFSDVSVRIYHYDDPQQPNEGGGTWWNLIGMIEVSWADWYAILP